MAMLRMAAIWTFLGAKKGNEINELDVLSSLRSGAIYKV